MKEFGWSIEYTLNLTYPVFFNLYDLICRVRLDSAYEQFYVPYSALKVGKEPAKSLFNAKDSFFIDDSVRVTPKEYTPDMLEKTNQRLRERIERHRKIELS